MTRKKLLAIAVSASLILASGVVYAKGRGMGMFGCNKNVEIEKIQEFQKDTSQLRDEMMIKRIELQREQSKDTPDQARVNSLKGELQAVRAKIHEAGGKYGMFADCPKDQDCWEQGRFGNNKGCGGGPANGGCRSCNNR